MVVYAAHGPPFLPVLHSWLSRPVRLICEQSLIAVPAPGRLPTAYCNVSFITLVHTEALGPAALATLQRTHKAFLFLVMIVDLAAVVQTLGLRPGGVLGCVSWLMLCVLDRAVRPLATRQL